MLSKVHQYIVTEAVFQFMLLGSPMIKLVEAGLNDRAENYLPTELLINNLPPGNGAGMATGPANEATID